jgi:hypothetical protein
MNTQYVQYHRKLLQALQQAAAQAMPTNELSEEDQQLLEQLDHITNSKSFDETFFDIGQRALCRIVAAHPFLAPQVPRDLFWLFGGDCLHFMPDEEISLYQQLDELRFEAENDNTVFDYEKQRARILGLH